MLKKAVIACCLFMALTLAVVSADAALQKADDLFKFDKLEEAKAELLALLPTKSDPVEKSEVLWRLSRVVLNIGDEFEAEKASKDVLFATYEEAQAYAEQALALHPSAKGYQWKAASVGRWGETKGPLNALSKAAPMKNDLATVVNDFNDVDNSDAWYILGQLYFQLPGKPISFGNLEAAISYTRKAVDTIPKDELYPGHYLALAKMLWKRNWSASTRNTKITAMQKEWDKGAAKSALDRHWYYEGSSGATLKPFYSPVALNAMSDRQEAIMLLQYGTNAYKVWPIKTRGDARSYDEIQELLTEYR